MDFLERMREVIREANENAPAPRVNLQRRMEQEERIRVSGEVYNIHKRSLPPGLDQPILWNIPLAEAQYWIHNKLKAKLVDSEKRIVHYYDKVRQDGHKAGIFDNDYDANTLLKEEPHDKLEVFKTPEANEPDWKG